MALSVPNSCLAGVVAPKRAAPIGISEQDSTMALLDRIRNNRPRTLALAPAAAIALLAIARPSPAMAAETPPAPLEASDDADPLGVELGSRPGSRADRAGRPVADAGGGYIYRNGRYTPLDTVDALLTVHATINNRGQTAGPYFRRGPDVLDLGGFVRSRRGAYTRVDVALGPSTWPRGINDRGAIVGVYGNPETGEAGPFLRKPNGVVATVKVPGASVNGLEGINNRGAVIGHYGDADGVDHAFVMDRGRVTTLVPPDAPDDPVAANVYVHDLNDRGQVVGCYADVNGTYHGFLYDKGRFTRIDPSGGADVALYATTCALGINNRSQVVGQYVDAASVLHGYLWQRGRGFDTIDPPRGAPMVGPTGIRGTVAADINDRGEILLPAPSSFYKGRVATIRG
jgi:probable HAF family extracellular repeat protein